MGVYMEMLMVSVVTVYVVDLSGCTDSWRGALARWLKTSPQRLRALPPFDCGQCMSWWICLGYALICGKFSVETVLWSALLAFLSTVTGQLLLLIRELLLFMINQVMKRI